MNQPRKFWLNLFKHPTTYGMAYRTKEDAEKQSADCSLCEAVVEVQEVLPNQPTTTMNNQWISTKDRLPLFWQSVLFARPDKESVKCGFLADDLIWHSGKEQYNGRNAPTHWQPLPDPPPKPDAFEEWWRELRGCLEGEESRRISLASPHPVNKRDARLIWDAALASKP